MRFVTGLEDFLLLAAKIYGFFLKSAFLLVGYLARGGVKTCRTATYGEFGKPRCLALLQSLLAETSRTWRPPFIGGTRSSCRTSACYSEKVFRADATPRMR